MKGNIFAEGVLRGLDEYEKFMDPYRDRVHKATDSGEGEEEARAEFWEAEERFRNRRVKK